MIELKDIEDKKTLSGESWIELDKDTKFRVDYPTRGQETQQRLLRMRWEAGKNSENDPHWIGYYLQTTIKEVQGFVDDSGKQFKLVLENGIATWLVSGEKKLPFLAVMTELGLVEAVFGLIYKRLEMTELSKKKLLSPRPSSKKESFARGQKPSRPAKSPTAGSPSEETVAGTLSSVTA